MAHWNVLHGWGRYWDQPGQNGILWPPAGSFSAISDNGGAPNGQTYGQPTGEPVGGCGTAPHLATWRIATNGPMQTLLRSADLGADPLLVAMTLSEGTDCISAAEVKSALAAGSSEWSTTGKSVQSGRDGLIARYGWASPAAPSMTAWDPVTNPGGDMVQIFCRENKYQAVHGYIFTDAARTPSKAVHLFATRLKGDHICETQRLDEFIRAKAGTSSRILVMGDFNFAKGEVYYNDLLGRNYIEAGSSPLIPAGSDKNALTCCFGTENGLSDGRVHSTRIDLGFHDNVPYATSYWVGNKTILQPNDEVAMSDHAVIKIGFTETGPVTDPVIDTPLNASPNPAPVGQAVTFSVQAHDPDPGDSLAYTWTFGDGSQTTTTANTVQHTYATVQNVTAKVTITDGRGGLAWSTRAVSIASGGCSGPPAPWGTADVGTGVNGSTCLQSGTYTMTAGGDDVWAGSDAFHFVYQPLNGDGEISAFISDMTLPAGAAFTLGGVMIRADLSAASMHATMMTTTQDKAKFRRRVTTGAATTLSDGPSAGTQPFRTWVKVKRVGNTFTGYLSSDGVTWNQVGPSEVIAMPANTLIGLVALRNGSTAPSATVTMNNVTVQGSGPAWQGADVGNAGPAGSQTQTGPASFSVTAGGDDVWAGADAFRFVYQPMSGDGEISAFISDLTLPTGAVFSLGGVMIRADLTAGSMHATMMTTTQDKAKFRRRVTTGATTTLSDGPSAGTQPFRTWVKVKRVGNTFTAYLSSDGATWNQVGPSEVIAMPANTLVGLVALRNGAAAGTMTGTFTNVAVVP